MAHMRAAYTRSAFNSLASRSAPMCRRRSRSIPPYDWSSAIAQHLLSFSQASTDRSHQLLQSEWFSQAILRAEFGGHREEIRSGSEEARELESGHGDDRHGRGALAERADGLETIRTRHENVDEDRVE